MTFVSKKITWEGKELTLETGKLATLANGSILATYGGTQILATVVVSKKPKLDIDFTPLTVHYIEKYYAVGKFPGGFFKREGKPSEREVLISRLIDRPIRPIVASDFKNEIQIVTTVLSYDKEVETDIIAIIASAAALAISGAKITNTIGAARVCLIDGKLVVNPKNTDLHGDNNKLDLVVSGTKDGVLMVESEACELSEEQMLEALDLGFNSFQPVIAMVEQLATEVNVEQIKVMPCDQDINGLEKAIHDHALSDLKLAFKISDKKHRVAKLDEVKQKVLSSVSSDFSQELIDMKFNASFSKVEKEVVRNMIMNEKVRIDGRSTTDIRKISAEVDLINMAHGSALFTRGETQALAVTTLGSEDDEQIIDNISSESRERFTLHYNFLPYSVGEVGRVAHPGRREIGHGKLAFRALNPLVPTDSQKFPYAIRVVSEILGSNGSSSMATVCASSMSLMAAGVPLAKPVAGIAMGLIKSEDQYSILSDILGDEDHLGDMDFKVAGTKEGITALQMDLKITSVDKKIMTEALSQAKEGRMHILEKMSHTIDAARTKVSGHTPKVKVLAINKDKIAEVIGPGGKVIKGIISKHNVKVSVKDDGLVTIYGDDDTNINNAMQEVIDKVVEPELNKVYQGKVVKVLDFGAFVNFMGNKDGFLHISEITGQRNANINDHVKMGEKITVKVIRIEGNGRVRLSAKSV